MSPSLVKEGVIPNNLVLLSTSVLAILPSQAYQNLPYFPRPAEMSPPETLSLAPPHLFFRPEPEMSSPKPGAL